MKKIKDAGRDNYIDEVLLAVKRSGVPYTVIQRRCGVSASTIYAWEAKTKRPQRLTIAFVLKAIGLRMGGIEPIHATNVVQFRKRAA